MSKRGIKDFEHEASFVLKIINNLYENANIVYKDHQDTLDWWGRLYKLNQIYDEHYKICYNGYNDMIILDKSLKGYFDEQHETLRKKYNNPEYFIKYLEDFCTNALSKSRKTFDALEEHIGTVKRRGIIRFNNFDIDEEKKFIGKFRDVIETDLKKVKEQYEKLKKCDIETKEQESERLEDYKRYYISIVEKNRKTTVTHTSGEKDEVELSDEEFKSIIKNIDDNELLECEDKDEVKRLAISEVQKINAPKMRKLTKEHNERRKLLPRGKMTSYERQREDDHIRDIHNEYKKVERREKKIEKTVKKFKDAAFQKLSPKEKQSYLVEYRRRIIGDMNMFIPDDKYEVMKITSTDFSNVIKSISDEKYMSFKSEDELERYVNIQLSNIMRKKESESKKNERSDNARKRSEIYKTIQKYKNKEADKVVKAWENEKKEKSQKKRDEEALKLGEENRKKRQDELNEKARLATEKAKEEKIAKNNEGREERRKMIDRYVANQNTRESKVDKKIREATKRLAERKANYEKEQHEKKLSTKLKKVGTLTKEKIKKTFKKLINRGSATESFSLMSEESLDMICDMIIASEGFEMLTESDLVDICLTIMNGCESLFRDDLYDEDDIAEEGFSPAYKTSLENRITELERDNKKLETRLYLKRYSDEEEMREIKAEIKANENILEKLKADFKKQNRYSIGEEGFVDTFKRYSRWCDETRTNLTINKDGIGISNNFADIRAWSNKAIKFYEKVKIGLEEMNESSEDEVFNTKIKEFTSELTELINSINRGIECLDNVDEGCLGRTTKITPGIDIDIFGINGVELSFTKNPKEVIITLPDDALLITSSTMLGKNKRRAIKTLNELKKFSKGK